MKIAILGAGAGGSSAAVELSQNGHHVRLWNRSAAGLAGFRASKGIQYAGVLGNGLMPVEVITTELSTAIENADVLVVCLPTLAHAALARALVDIKVVNIPTILNPGHTGGALEFSQVFRAQGYPPPPIAEFSTLTYVARKSSPERVVTTGRAKRVRVAAMPGGGAALDLSCLLYDCAKPADNVLVTSLCNVNMVLHPPGAILGAAWVEAKVGNFTFYVEGLTDGVARVMECLDLERRAVGRGLGLDLPPLFEEMQAIGTIEANVDEASGLAAAIRGGVANRAIKAPDGFMHRYFQEDFWYGLEPFLALATIAEVDTPTARSLMHLGVAAVGPMAPTRRRTALEMGIAGFDKAALLSFVSAG
jgi:opine dehydrogenase